MRKRVTARKYMGDDAASWAVFLDGRPFVTGLTRAEVAFYKKQAEKAASERSLLPPRKEARP